MLSNTAAACPYRVGASPIRKAHRMTPAGAVVRRETLRAQIADALRDEILAGRLAAGQHITVGEIAEQYGVSATPVREALVDLAAQGLLDVEQHRGYRVHAFTLDDFRAMADARTVVEMGVFHASPLHTVVPRPGALTAMRRRGEEAERAAKAGDLDVLVHYDLRFWREITSLIGNDYITEFLERVRIHCWVFAVPYLREECETCVPGTFWQGHMQLVEAIERRDVAAAEEVVRTYNRHSLELIERLAGG